MLGPILGGWGFGLGLEKGVVGAAFWVLMGLSALGTLVGLCAREGSGHEIVLEGDEVWESQSEERHGEDGKRQGDGVDTRVARGL